MKYFTTPWFFFLSIFNFIQKDLPILVFLQEQDGIYPLFPSANWIQKNLISKISGMCFRELMARYFKKETQIINTQMYFWQCNFPWNALVHMVVVGLSAGLFVGPLCVVGRSVKIS